MRIAIVHHWFISRGGGERVAECIASLFPAAEIFTLVASREGLPKGLHKRKLHTSFLQRLPFAASHHRHMLPLYPAATRSLDLRGFDLILSSDSGPIKGVILDPGAIQICYCHSPMRYVYDSFEFYRAQMPAFTRALFSATAPHVRRWDQRAAARVTYFLANSHYVADRIRRVYGREATVIHPPIDIDHAPPPARAPGTHYLCAGRLVAYKRTEILIEACAQLGRPLRVAGTGPELAALEKLAGPEVVFLGELSTEQLWQEYATCRALLFAADEDFGMVPLESQACGRPVIAYGAGGSLETVRAPLLECDLPEFEGPPTGVYFPEQTADSAAAGILEFEALEHTFSPEAMRAWAASFATPVFLKAMRNFILTHVPAAAAAMEPA